MSFLDENVTGGTLPTDPEYLKKVKDATDKAMKGDSTDLALLMAKGPQNEKKGRDLDGDGDIDSDDYLAARDKAIKRAQAKKKVNEKEYNQDISLDKFKAIQPGTEVQYMGSTSKVKSNDGFTLDLENGQKINYAMFNKKGRIPEGKQIKVDANQKFVIDLQHLLKKHGHDNTIKLTKKLMDKLHDKGEVEVDGTKLLFKEADIPQDMPVDLPKPKKQGPPRLVAFDTDQDSHFTGEDDYDYEGSMAKSELLKMKKYANALCDMIEDESQLEAWLQSKITKAADYMSSVYHYLDYQKSKMDEGFNFTLNDREIDDDFEIGGGHGTDLFISKAYYTNGEALSDDEIDALIDKYPADLELGGTWWDQNFR